METKTFQLLLVRHGISEANATHRFVGWTDVPLAEEGKIELARNKEKVGYPEVERYYCSDLKRARETFDVLFSDKHTVYQYRADLRETYYGNMEDAVIEKSIRQWFTDWASGVELGNNEEKMEFFRPRVEKALYDIVNETIKDGLNSCAIVAHSGFLKTLMLVLRNWQSSRFNEFWIGNGLGFDVTLKISENRIELVEERELKIND